MLPRTNERVDDSTWTLLNLPHKWNISMDRMEGNNYYRGIGWYRLHYKSAPTKRESACS